MIVVDASAMTELLLQTELGARVERRLFGTNDQLHVPHLIDVEVLSALRRLVRTGDVAPGRARDAIEDLASIGLVRHGHLDLVDRAWDLRKNVTVYDAMYIVLAESLDATFVTCDRPLGARRGHTVRIDVIR